MNDDLEDSQPEEKPAPSLYETLEVADDAAPEEIRRAYYRLVRRHRPDSNPDYFARLKEAYETLSDPKQRSEYDQLRRYGDRVNNLMAEARAAFEEDPQRALRLLKEAVLLAPDSTVPRLFLAGALMRLDEHAKAESELRRLVDNSPDDAFIRYQYGRSLLNQDRYEAAKDAFSHVIALDPTYFDAYIALSRVYMNTDDPEEAIVLLEKAILLNGTEDFTDFDVLLHLLVIYTLQVQHADADDVERRIRAVLPEEEEAVNYAMYRLFDIALDFYRAKNYEGARRIILRAHHERFTDEDLAKKISDFLNVTSKNAVISQIVHNDHLSEGVRAYLHYRHLDNEDEDDLEIEANFRKIMETIGQEVDTNSPRVRMTVSHIQFQFGEIYRIERDFFHKVETALEAINRPPVANPNSGGCFGVILTALSLGTVACSILAILNRPH